ncbi:hypothetical protein Kpol_526p52 [Vanderwaltozyma polyspora DSM 70294]|uniref:Tetrapyrrole methylase domain-containing protein n=1 Tax=Vanderwaltozyma polyspora (strain ATCC 22028 / DSM 70294 / BCRC 21397 / CBS 2163 / NBRC 10782 / NRRL Y-8283 / UCD 57-17) TaxID=436907 RepID=A7TLV7_VANPO|nr:uncharacterized protein Kpol_526p52 [Vanderwaltozyma polyspora DSM 70294]EDO16799.1 hypothetical protein Kpol_526p52 [Vanderwaltozyma polyspora DSM 70294]
MRELLQKRQLITSSDCKGEIHLILGSIDSNSFFARIKSIINIGAIPKIICNDKQLSSIIDSKFPNHDISVLEKDYDGNDVIFHGRFEVNNVVDRVYLYETDSVKLNEIFNTCQKNRIPINTYQNRNFSTFHCPSTYIDPENSGLQITVSTDGNGCLLANRIKREIVSNLPSNISKTVRNMGILREKIINEENISSSPEGKKLLLDYGMLDGDDCWDNHNFNRLSTKINTEYGKKLKRTRWLSQFMEYYPLSRLADLNIDDFAEFKNLPIGNSRNFKYDITDDIISKVQSKKRKIQSSISLIGSGPGSLSMLTLGALKEIKSADVILADKLVPQEVLDVIPSSTETFIARKFPGNASKAQEELLNKGLEYLQNGKRVVRLKQGDPYVYGRGGEEYLFFKENGYTPLVLPGISSALSSTVLSNIPATQRNIADQILICTGTLKDGKLPELPTYSPTRTTIFLMVLHRIDEFTKAISEHGWDINSPVAIVERSSCKDQRVVRTKLKYLPEVVKEVGSRPPGVLIFGNAVNALVDITIDEYNKYNIEEGFREFEIDAEQLLK